MPSLSLAISCRSDLKRDAMFPFLGLNVQNLKFSQWTFLFITFCLIGDFILTGSFEVSKQASKEAREPYQKINPVAQVKQTLKHSGIR